MRASEASVKRLHISTNSAASQERRCARQAPQMWETSSNKILRQRAASPLGGGDGAVASVPFAFDEVGLLHRESAALVGQINAEVLCVKWPNVKFAAIEQLDPIS